MTLTQLRYIVSIVDAGLNITAAAERVHATQPTISKQLKQLEGELGFLLFARKGKSLAAITPAGEQVLTIAREVVERARSIRSLAANLRGDARGALTLVATHTQARYVLPDVVGDFNRRFPAVAVHIRPQEGARILDQFAAGYADLALISTSGDTTPGTGVALPVFRWSRVVAVPRGHPLVRLLRPLRLQDLAAHPLVSYDSSLRHDSSLQRAFRAAGLTPRLACTSSDADLVKTYVRAGLGVGVYAEMAVEPGDRQDLVYLDAPALLPDCTTWLVLRRDRVIRSFALALVQRMAPQIKLHEVRAALNDAQATPAWPLPPAWAERHRVHPPLRALA